MRVMAVDLGSVRTGVAVSDLSGTMAGETFVIAQANKNKLADMLRDEAMTRGVSTIVLGKPVNMNGTEGEQAQRSKEFAEMLAKKAGLPVVLWDERGTTVDAARILHAVGKHGKKNRSKVDAVAAALILEAYLDRKLTARNGNVGFDDAFD